ncbi:MAG: DISARM system helicase DrmA, partial [Acidobacteriota bacterium]
MKVIKLPPVLPGDLDLAEINRQLREHTVQLDWSAVESVSEKYLAILLQGLNDRDDADVLGLDGEIADLIGGNIAQFFTQQSASHHKEKQALSDNEKALSPQVRSTPTTQDADSSSMDIDAEADPVDISIVEKTLAQPVAANLLTVPSPYAIRAELEKAVLDDLLGPAGGEHEEIDEQKVSDRYLVGLLAPLYRKQQIEQETDEDLAVAGKDSSEDGRTDISIAAAKTMMPSSFGMTFCVSNAAKAIKIQAAWGKYDRVESEYITTEKGNPKTVWRRQPIIDTSPPVPLQDGAIDKWIVDANFPDVYVQGLIRKQNDEWIVSIFLINGQREPDKLSDAAWLFQPELSVKSADPDFPDIFVRRPQLLSTVKTDSRLYLEEQSMNMLYRSQVEFAIGHGVSVHADTVPNTTERAIRICTSVVPTYEVPKVTPPTSDEIPDLAGLVLDMKELAETPIDQLSAKLKALTVAYRRWIDGQKSRIKDPQEGLASFQTIADAAINNCTYTLERISEGMALLDKDAKAAQAFQFMNRAMWQQRIHSIFSERKRRGEDIELSTVDIPQNRTWFPFQLAFILLNLPSITDLHHEDRCHETNAIADLLWFPTGGGKTEAYLGLTAYTLALRRLQGTIAGRVGEYGIAVLMRYTLRLLTLQQFQRATALICACESIRREAIQNGEAKWGQEPFRIGLWVGKKTTPNTTQQSEEFSKQVRGYYQAASGSPHQLTNCPWCGTKIDEGKNIKVEPYSRGPGRTLIYCGDPFGRCLFDEKNSSTEGLPIVVVDEEIYRRLPSLLISTVDKFAQMPWNGATQMLFGQVEAYCQRHGFKSPEIEDSSHPRRQALLSTKLASHNPLRPPDLIIQDELHLISGPLGTLVGLYETAVDKLASWEVDGKQVRPKVIASTATIRQAKEQVYNLFLRKVQVFPPQCLDANDNFFARQRIPSDKDPGRRYLGICAPGRRLTAALIRVYIAILSASQAMYLKYATAADPWMTLVGYFNSLRELAGMRR